jgi:hypothetical protein
MDMRGHYHAHTKNVRKKNEMTAPRRPSVVRRCFGPPRAERRYGTL